MLRFPMHIGNRKIALKDILLILGPEAVRDCDRHLSVVFLDVIGRAPQGLTMEAFDDLIRAAPNGFPMTWQELSSFAENIDDLNECLIVGVHPGQVIDAERVLAEHWEDCCCVIEGFDSSTWSIIVGGDTAQEELASRLRPLVGAIQILKRGPDL